MHDGSQKPNLRRKR